MFNKNNKLKRFEKGFLKSTIIMVKVAILGVILASIGVFLFGICILLENGVNCSNYTFTGAGLIIFGCKGVVKGIHMNSDCNRDYKPELINYIKKYYD